MSVGDKKTVEIPADEAYGQRQDEAMQTVPREQIPDDIPLEVGTQLQVQTPTGQVMPVMVAEVSSVRDMVSAQMGSAITAPVFLRPM